MSKLNHAKVNMKERIARESSAAYAEQAHASAAMLGCRPGYHRPYARSTRSTRKRRLDTHAITYLRTHKQPARCSEMDRFIAHRISEAQAARKEHAC